MYRNQKTDISKAILYAIDIALGEAPLNGWKELDLYLIEHFTSKVEYFLLNEFAHTALMRYVNTLNEMMYNGYVCILTENDYRWLYCKFVE